MELTDMCKRASPDERAKFAMVPKATKIIREKQPTSLCNLLHKCFFLEKESGVLLNSLMDQKGTNPYKTDWHVGRRSLNHGLIKN